MNNFLNKEIILPKKLNIFLFNVYPLLFLLITYLSAILSLSLLLWVLSGIFNKGFINSPFGAAYLLIFIGILIFTPLVLIGFVSLKRTFTHSDYNRSNTQRHIVITMNGLFVISSLVLTIIKIINLV